MSETIPKLGVKYLKINPAQVIRVAANFIARKKMFRRKESPLKF